VEAPVIARALSRSQRELLRRLFAGEQQKAVALELGISTAAITQRLQRSARQLGARGIWAQWPLFLLVSGAAFHATPQIDVRARITRALRDGRERAICSFDRPDQELPLDLSVAEREVARHVVEGASPLEIAARRGTSARTVRNQISAVFAKLGVSGRVELVRLLVCRAGARERAYSGQQ
jgi:DNA-binding CsgD family transcriptional regulator